MSELRKESVCLFLFICKLDFNVHEDGENGNGYCSKLHEFRITSFGESPQGGRLLNCYLQLQRVTVFMEERTKLV